MSDQYFPAKLYKTDYDSETGTTEEFWYMENKVKGGSGRITIRRFQDVEDTLDFNKEQFNSHAGKKPSYGDSNGNHKVATIPTVLIEKWMREGFNWYASTDNERKAKLNDPDNRKLLVRPGKL